MSDLISRQKISYAVESFREDYISQYKILMLINQMSSIELDRKFLEIIAEYPKICTYPEYKGKPYYSIKYEENGETIVGFGTYKPEVLSQYLREYFILSVKPEQKKGKWVDGILYQDFDESEWEKVKCSVCKNFVVKQIFYHDNKYHFCPYCGADMRGD